MCGVPPAASPPQPALFPPALKKRPVPDRPFSLSLRPLVLGSPSRGFLSEAGRRRRQEAFPAKQNRLRCSILLFPRNPGRGTASHFCWNCSISERNGVEFGSDSPYGPLAGWQAVRPAGRAGAIRRSRRAVVAQLVRAPDCGSGGRWFEPSQRYHLNTGNSAFVLVVRAALCDRRCDLRDERAGLIWPWRSGARKRTTRRGGRVPCLSGDVIVRRRERLHFSRKRSTTSFQAIPDGKPLLLEFPRTCSSDQREQCGTPRRFPTLRRFRRQGGRKS